MGRCVSFTSSRVKRFQGERHRIKVRRVESHGIGDMTMLIRCTILLKQNYDVAFSCPSRSRDDNDFGPSKSTRLVSIARAIVMKVPHGIGRSSST